MAEHMVELNKNDNEVIGNWNDITSDVLSNAGYTCPHNMVCFIKGFVISQGVYFANPQINGSRDTCSFSGYSNTDYGIMHYFYARKGDVITQLNVNNLKTVKYYAIQAD